MSKVLKIILIPVVCFFIFNLYILLSSKNDMQYAVYGTRENTVAAEGYIIKSEALMKADGDKRFYYSDGERVSKGVRIASYVSKNTDDALLYELATVESQIRLLRDGNTGDASADPAVLNEQIKQKTRELIYYVSEKDFSGADDVKNEIMLLKSHEANTGGVSAEDMLSQLYAQKAQLEGKIDSSGASVYAPVAGILYLASDGFENVLYPDMISELTVSRLLNIESEKQASNEGDCKITDNFRYYIAAVMENADAEDLEAGKTISLRFSGFSSDAVKADVEYVSVEENGKKVVVFSCNKMAESLLSAREVSFEVIKSSYEGFILPASAVTTLDGAEGVYVKNGVNHDFRKVKVMYRDEETVIISKQNSEENELLIYDNVVVNP